jgi:hypothetical protein
MKNLVRFRIKLVEVVVKLLNKKFVKSIKLFKLRILQTRHKVSEIQYKVRELGVRLIKSITKSIKLGTKKLCSGIGRGRGIWKVLRIYRKKKIRRMYKKSPVPCKV